jgi:hypothetical protein
LNGILVIRGGAIDDFILALPALNALRDATSNPRVARSGRRFTPA